MTDEKRQSLKDEVAHQIIDTCESFGGVLEAGKKVELEGDVKVRHERACKEAEKYADKDGKVDSHVQAIFARMYGLI